MRVKGRHLNLNKAAPTSVEEMKEGEMRITADTMYGRIGNQILSHPLTVGPYNFMLWGEANPALGNTEGVILETALSQSDMGQPGFNRAWKSAMLTDGRVVVAGYDQTQIAIKCFHFGTTTQDWLTPITGETSHPDTYCDIIVLTNNNIVIAWADSSARGWFMILDSDGNIITSKSTFDGGINCYREHYSMIALPDGGFVIKYEQYPGGPGDWDFISIRNANGSQRVANFAPAYEDYGFQKMGVFEGSGNILVPAANNTFVYIYDPTDGTELINGVEDDQYYSSENIAFYNILLAKLPSWTDQLAIFYGNDVDEIRGSIHKDVGSDPWWGDPWDVQIYSGGPGVRLIDVFATQDDQFILQYRDHTDLVYGGYLILDGSLNVVSGPHIAFTDVISSVQDEGWLKGCSI